MIFYLNHPINTALSYTKISNSLLLLGYHLNLQSLKATFLSFLEYLLSIPSWPVK